MLAAFQADHPELTQDINNNKDEVIMMQDESDTDIISESSDSE
jgi:hypothetical protein